MILLFSDSRQWEVKEGLERRERMGRPVATQIVRKTPTMPLEAAVMVLLTVRVKRRLFDQLKLR